MSDTRPAADRSGLLVFLVIALVLIAIAIIVADMTGGVGIEERFSSAVGITSGTGAAEDAGQNGFSLEGHPLLYGIFLAVLLIACLTLYRKYRI
ncbi:MAG: hypothetical protein WC586_10680 [Methanoregula sp.]